MKLPIVVCTKCYSAVFKFHTLREKYPLCKAFIRRWNILVDPLVDSFHDLVCFPW